MTSRLACSVSTASTLYANEWRMLCAEMRISLIAFTVSRNCVCVICATVSALLLWEKHGIGGTHAALELKRVRRGELHELAARVVALDAEHLARVVHADVADGVRAVRRVHRRRPEIVGRVRDPRAGAATEKICQFLFQGKRGKGWQGRKRERSSKFAGNA